MSLRLCDFALNSGAICGSISPLNYNARQSKASPAKASAPVGARPPIPAWLIAALLALVTLALYWPALRYGFLDFDDPDFVSGNQHIHGGVNWGGVKWAFHNTEQAAYWAPLMWLSHMLAWQWFGPNAWGHHFINVLLHAANTALVFVVLRRLTGATWRSLIVAALFGWHPLRVESVVWITERKDVLSTCFGLLALLFYARYAQAKQGAGALATDCTDYTEKEREWKPPAEAEDRPPAGSGIPSGKSVQSVQSVAIPYCLSLFFFTLALLSKTMLVTLPFAFLLLDYWPLRRFGIFFPVPSVKSVADVPHPSSLPSSAVVVSPSPCDEGAGRGLGRGEQSSSPVPSVESVADVPHPSSLPSSAVAASPSPCDEGAGRGLGRGVSEPSSEPAPSSKLEVESSMFDVRRSSFLRRFLPLLLEKWPFLLLSAAACVATILAQRKSIVPVQNIDFLPRLGNVVVAYAAYVGQMFYPAGLAVFYPHPGNHLSVWKAGLSVVVLLMISAGAIAGRRKHPCLLVGWLWYLGMLVPVIGLMQVGDQARADRYTYLPQIGLYILAVWGAVELCGPWRRRRAVLGSAAAAIFAGLLACAYLQTGYWKNSISLWTHTLACASESYVAHNNLGLVLAVQGKLDDAVQHWERALVLKPDSVETHINLGNALAIQGKLDEANQQYERALQLKPDSAEILMNLGNALADQGKLTEAIPRFQQALILATVQSNAPFAEAIQARLESCQSILAR